MRRSYRNKPKSLGATIALLIVSAIGAYFYPQLHSRERTQVDQPKPAGERVTIHTPTLDSPVERPAGKTPTITGDGGIAKLNRDRRSNVIVATGGTVAKVLPDDTDTSDGSSRHQRFIVRLSTGDTVLIAHNIDLAGRVPAREGDVIRFKGEYEWTDRGGVVHWTHRDPRNRREGGWVELDGKRYE